MTLYNTYSDYSVSKRETAPTYYYQGGRAGGIQNDYVIGVKSFFAFFVSTMSDSPKLRELIEELIEIKKKWYIIGLQLTIPEETLDKIEEISCDEDEALRRMLQEWRKLVDPSWAAVLEALRSRSVNEHCLAANLQEKYIDAERGSCESGGTTPANLQLVPSSTAGARK